MVGKWTWTVYTVHMKKVYVAFLTLWLNHLLMKKYLMTLIKIPIKNPSGYHPLSLTMRSSTSLLRPTPQLNKGQGSTPGHKVYLFKILINHSPVFLIWSCFIIYFRPLFILFLYQCCTPLYFFTHDLHEIFFLINTKSIRCGYFKYFSVLKDFLAWILILFVCLS